MTVAKKLPFSSMQKGMRARVASVSGDSPALRRLVDMGLTVGTEFEVVRVAPLGDPIEIALRGYRLCVRRKETEGIEVEIAA